MKKLLIFLYLFSLTLILPGAPINPYSDAVRPQWYDAFYGRKNRIYLDGKWDFIKGGKGKIAVPNYTDWKKGGAHTVGRSFTMPDFSGKRVLLTFRGIGWNPKVQINGKTLPQILNIAPGSLVDEQLIDVTKYVKKGSNRIVAQYDYPDQQGRRKAAGIYGVCFLEIVEPVYAEYITVNSKINGRIKLKTMIVNSTDKTLTLPVDALIAPWKTPEKSKKISLGKISVKPGKKEYTFDLKYPSPRLWSEEDPYLYSFELRSSSGRLGLTRFGFREFAIRGKHFYLNGRQIQLHAVAAEEGHLGRIMVIEAINPQLNNNGGNLLSDYFKQLKKANFNSIMRFPNGAGNITALELADEHGLLVFYYWHLWKMFTVLPENVTKRILNDGVEYDSMRNGFFLKNGKILPGSVFNKPGRDAYLYETHLKLARKLVNHPSVVAIGIGDENFRECNQAFDLPLERKALYEYMPGAVVFGCHGISDSSMDLNGKRVKHVAAQDLVNFAGVSCGGAAGQYCHYTVWDHTMKYCAENWAYNRYKREIPTIATEALYYGDMRTMLLGRLWRWNVNTYKDLIVNGVPDRKKTLKLLSQPAIEKFYQEKNPRKRARMLSKIQFKHGWWPFRQTIKITGLHENFLDHKVINRSIARRLKPMTELVRINDRYLQGLATVTGPVLEYDMKGMEKLRSGSIKGLSPIGEQFKKGFAPVAVMIDIYRNGTNFLAGTKRNTRLYCFNNGSKEYGKVTVTAKFMDKSSVSTMDFTGKRKISVPFTLRIPENAETGFHTMTLEMKSGGKNLACNEYKFFVLSKQDSRASGKVLLLDKTDSGLAALLKKLGKTVNTVSAVPASPAKYPLIIAPGALNKNNAPALAKLLKAGQKILLLEQPAGVNPLLPEYSVFKLSNRNRGKIVPEFGIDLLIVDKHSPAFKLVNDRDNWSALNNRHGAVYHTLIGPLDDNALAIGADIGQSENCRLFGTLLLKKDDLLWSQATIVPAALRGDSAAIRHLLNLISMSEK